MPNTEQRAHTATLRLPAAKQQNLNDNKASLALHVHWTCTRYEVCAPVQLSAWKRVWDRLLLRGPTPGQDDQTAPAPDAGNEKRQRKK